MKKLLSFSIIVVLAVAFNMGCKQDSVSSGGPNSSASVQKNQKPANSIAKAAEKTEDDEDDDGDSSDKIVQHYKAHLIDVLSLNDPHYGFGIPTITECNVQHFALNADLDVKVNSSGKWHMTVSNFKVMDWELFQQYSGFYSTQNDAFNAAIADNGVSDFGPISAGSGPWLDKGGHYKAGQKLRPSVTVRITDVWQLYFTRNASGVFSCEMSMCQ